MTKRKIKKCQICGIDLTGTKQNKVCLNSDCQEKYKKLKYSQKKFKHICKYCGIEFITIGYGEKRVLCDDCQKHKIYNYKKTIEQSVICSKCGKLLYIEIKKGGRAQNQRYGGVCDECKKINNKNSAERMKLKNPSYHGQILTIEEYENKQELKKTKREEIEIKKEQNKQNSSERMKVNNPMKIPEIKNKVAATLKLKYKLGVIKLPRGLERKNFKGNSRTILQYFRLSLRQWRIDNLKRANYTCELCGKRGGSLHIHHLEPFNEIVNKISQSLKIDLNNIKYADEKFIKIEKEIIFYHNNNDIGIVVCPDCHDKIDKKYHKSKKERGYENKIR